MLLTSFGICSTHVHFHIHLNLYNICGMLLGKAQSKQYQIQWNCHKLHTCIVILHYLSMSVGALSLKSFISIEPLVVQSLFNLENDQGGILEFHKFKLPCNMNKCQFHKLQMQSKPFKIIVVVWQVNTQTNRHPARYTHSEEITLSLFLSIVNTNYWNSLQKDGPYFYFIYLAHTICLFIKLCRISCQLCVQYPPPPS